MQNISDKTLDGNISKKLQLQAVENCCQTEISNSKQTPVRTRSHWLTPGRWAVIGWIQRNHFYLFQLLTFINKIMMAPLHN